MSGEAYHFILQTLGVDNSLRFNGTNTERWLGVRMLRAGLLVARFPMTGYTGCDLGAVVQQVDASRPHYTLTAFVCSEDRDGRYPAEKERVMAMAACIANGSSLPTIAGTWSLGNVQRCYCAIANGRPIE